MNFGAYIERQKILLLNRRVGEEELLTGNSVTLLRPSDEVFLELNSLKGLGKGKRHVLFEEVER
jgi:hypothetical protein